MQEGRFNQDGKVEFSVVKSKPRDRTRLQGARFMDRPDLWRKRKHLKPERIPPEQGELF